MTIKSANKLQEVLPFGLKNVKTTACLPPISVVWLLVSPLTLRNLTNKWNKINTPCSYKQWNEKCSVFNLVRWLVINAKTQNSNNTIRKILHERFHWITKPYDLVHKLKNFNRLVQSKQYHRNVLGKVNDLIYRLEKKDEPKRACRTAPGREACSGATKTVLGNPTQKSLSSQPTFILMFLW